MVEKGTPPEGLSEDTVAGALARRQKFLGTETLSPAEIAHKQACICSVPTNEARAIDAITTLALFQQRLPKHKGIKELIATETGSLSLDKGLVVYRLTNGDWIEPVIGHWIPACFPWAHAFEKALQESVKNPPPEEQSLVPNLQQQTESAARTITQKNSH